MPNLITQIYQQKKSYKAEILIRVRFPILLKISVNSNQYYSFIDKFQDLGLQNQSTYLL